MCNCYRITIITAIMVLAVSNLCFGQESSPDDIYWSDNFFTSGLDNFDEGNAMTLYNGNLVVGGAFGHADGIGTRNIAGWNGTNWYPFGDGLDTSIYSLTVYNGQLIAGLKYNSGSCIYYWDESSGWSSLGGGINGGVYSLIVFDGELIAAGSFSEAGGVPVNNIAKWNGIKWDSLSSGIDGTYSGRIYDMASYDNNLIVVGDITSAGGVNCSNIARWDGVSWDSLGVGIIGDDMFFQAVVNSVVPFNNELYVGGKFSDSAGNVSSNLAIWDGVIWKPFVCDYNIESIDAMIVYDSTLILSGDFTNGLLEPVNNVLSWNSTNCILFNEDTDEEIKEFTIYGDDLIAMGDFRMAPPCQYK